MTPTQAREIWAGLSEAQRTRFMALFCERWQHLPQTAMSVVHELDVMGLVELAEPPIWAGRLTPAGIALRQAMEEMDG